jgi:flagellar motor switch protein FliG
MASALSGLDKAVVLLQVLDRNAMSRIVSRLSVHEIALLRRHLESHPGLKADEEDVREVLRQFLSQYNSPPSDHLREVLNQAVGPEGEEEIERQVRWQGLSERVAPERMAAALKDEKPVTIAVALSRFPARYSGEVLAHFPEQKRLESVEQLSRGVRVAGDVADAILGALEAALSRTSALDDEVHGNAAEYTARVLNQIGADEADKLVEHIAAKDPNLARAIQQEMFHFEDLLRLDNRTLQTVLSGVRVELLAVALKGIPADLQAVVMAAMTEDRGKILREEMDALGPMPTREVQVARQEIISIVLKLEHEGRVRVRRGEEMVV